LLDHSTTFTHSNFDANHHADRDADLLSNGYTFCDTDTNLYQRSNPDQHSYPHTHPNSYYPLRLGEG
jgi:hypothetical protein